MPRPKKDDSRVWPTAVRYSSDERIRLRKRATAAGHKTISAFIRAVSLDEEPDTHRPSMRVAALVKEPAARGRFAGLLRRMTAQPEPAPSQPESVVADDQAMQIFHELRRIGVNVNQIAHKLNDFQQVTPAELTATLAELRACLQRVRPAAP